ncbi:MAG: hypothetical protein U0359_28180 [Byssovorax sp.]
MSAPVPPSSARRHTIVLSDVHLSQAHPDDPSDPMWMRYRRREFHPDAEFASLVDHLLETRGDDSIEVAWNGDVFDFDAPWVKDGTSSTDEFPLTDAGCAEHARRIIADHPGWFRAAARLVLRGHRLLLLSGNHDIELYWPGVRRAIREEIGALAALEAGRPDPLDEATLEERIRFRTWFHLTEDGIYLEHGSQYDMFNGVRHAMLPVTRARDWIHPQMGKLAFKRTGSRMGYFNPYYEETFYMGLFGYLGHFFEHYAGRDKHIFRVWFMGAVRTAAEIWKHRHSEDWRAEARALARAETGASDEAIDATHALGVPQAEIWMIPILRELWLDRLFLILFTITAVSIAFLIGGQVPALVTLGAVAALILAYELIVPKPDIRTYDSAPPTVKQLFEIHRAKAICMGHTHRPFSIWEEGAKGPRFYGNSGSWCPAFLDHACTQRVLPKRPLLLLTSEDGELHGGLHWWDGETLTADPDARPAPAQRT